MVNLLRRSRLAPALVALALLAGCGANPITRVSPDWRVNLTHNDPDVRIQAIGIALEEGSKEALPLLVDRLEDEDAAARMFAYHALRKLSGEDLGFHPYAGDAQRADEVRRWRDRWPGKKQGGAPAAPVEKKS
ncbi:MAG: HEAT repeat domain-containing protein [Planctomycetes bacterium]|nr:HEAT repeat domain-containing protein [Planctomycetota bacterium]